MSNTHKANESTIKSVRTTSIRTMKRLFGCLSESQPLGEPLPNDEHACSVSLPTWRDVVGYEEGDPDVTNALNTGYPRFVYHNYNLQLMEYVLEKFGKPNEDCLILPTAQSASRCQAFLQQALENRATIDNALICQQVPNSDSSSIRTVNLDSIHAVIFPAETTAGVTAKAYWQHTGEVVSSRRAECMLKSLDILPNRLANNNCESTSFCDDNVSGQLKQQISGLANVGTDAVFLTPSGMASIYSALRSARRHKMDRYKNGGTSIVFGFPYLDTLKLCSRPELSPGGVEFFGRGDDRDMKNLGLFLEKNPRVSALFTEVPSNPLLKTPNLYRLRELADKHDFALVVDDTISNFLNIDVIGTGLADAICTSLTKLVSGKGDAMAGSIIANPNTKLGQWMKQDLETYHDAAALFPADTKAILKNSQDFVHRNSVINKNALALAQWFDEHPDVETVYYPHESETYQSLMKPNAGYGSLMSVILDSHKCQRTFYDAVNLPKGPSLGTNFTLLCPYTLLAHYHELDFAMNYNVLPNLLRISVGMEDIDVLKDKFSKAFHNSRLYPKVSNTMQKRQYTTTTGAGCWSTKACSPTTKSLLWLTRRLVR